jgi:hypothetical protein
MPKINVLGHELTGSQEAIDAFNKFMVNRANAECERMDKAQQTINSIYAQLKELEKQIGAEDE